jgi:hypothetical protein
MKMVLFLLFTLSFLTNLTDNLNLLIQDFLKNFKSLTKFLYHRSNLLWVVLLSNHHFQWIFFLKFHFLLFHLDNQFNIEYLEYKTFYYRCLLTQLNTLLPSIVIIDHIFHFLLHRMMLLKFWLKLLLIIFE